MSKGAFVLKTNAPSKLERERGQQAAREIARLSQQARRLVHETADHVHESSHGENLPDKSRRAAPTGVMPGIKALARQGRAPCHTIELNGQSQVD